MPRKPKMTDEERRAYSAKMRGELEAVMDRAYGAMVASEKFWATVMRTATNLTHPDRDDRSPTNCIAIAAQHPNATHVLSSGDWRKAGRFPVKGSTSLRIWTPIKQRPEGAQDATATATDGGQREAASEAAEGETRKVSGFKAGPVFDISQTDGDAYEPPAAALLAAEAIRDVLVNQYRDQYHEDPEQAGGFDFTQEAPDNAARILLYGHAWRRITEADAPFPASTPPKSPQPPTSPRSSSESLRAPPSCRRSRASSPRTRSPRCMSPPSGSSRPAAPSPAPSGRPPSAAANLP